MSAGFAFIIVFQYYKEDQRVDKGIFIINIWKGKEKMNEIGQVESGT